MNTPASRPIAKLFVLLFLMSVSGCIPKGVRFFPKRDRVAKYMVLSEHPLCDEETSTIDDELIGEWKDDRPHVKEVAVIRRKEGSDNVLQLIDPAFSDEPLDLFCTKIGSGRYLCWGNEHEGYIIWRYEFNDHNQCKVYVLNCDRVAAAIRAGEIVGKECRITAESELIKLFLFKEGKNCFEHTGTPFGTRLVEASPSR